ncbi:MAG: helix-turn-helix transcriptional regulator [Bryobacterales bacterium]|nr:helix-turn-helix transcriptional regulator [Bryobacterales bacterium]
MRVAARSFAECGLDARLDDIADEADVARATLYAHFPTKEALIAAVVQSAVDAAARGVSAIHEADPRQAVRALLRLQLDLWNGYPDAMRVGHQLRTKPVDGAAHTHDATLRAILGIFERAQNAGILRCGDAAIAARLHTRIAIPLLEVLAGHPDRDRIFLGSLEGMLLRRASPPQG